MTAFDPSINKLTSGFSNIGNLFFSKKKEKLERIETENGVKIVVPILKRTKYELSYYEKCQSRTFYWAAFYGREKSILYMIMNLRWSPFIKAYQD